MHPSQRCEKQNRGIRELPSHPKASSVVSASLSFEALFLRHTIPSFRHSIIPQNHRLSRKKPTKITGDPHRPSTRCRAGECLSTAHGREDDLGLMSAPPWGAFGGAEAGHLDRRQTRRTRLIDGGQRPVPGPAGPAQRSACSRLSAIPSISFAEPDCAVSNHLLLSAGPRAIRIGVMPKRKAPIAQSCSKTIF